jgi:hypothetical protein
MSQDHNHLNHATWEYRYHDRSRRSIARRRCLAKSGGTWALYSASLLGARNGTCRPDQCAYADIDPPKNSVAEVIGWLKGKSSI